MRIPTDGFGSTNHKKTQESETEENSDDSQTSFSQISVSSSTNLPEVSWFTAVEPVSQDLVISDTQLENKEKSNPRKRRQSPDFDSSHTKRLKIVSSETNISVSDNTESNLPIQQVNQVGPITKFCQEQSEIYKSFKELWQRWQESFSSKNASLENKKTHDYGLEIEYLIERIISNYPKLFSKESKLSSKKLLDQLILFAFFKNPLQITDTIIFSYDLTLSDAVQEPNFYAKILDLIQAFKHKLLINNYASRSAPINISMVTNDDINLIVNNLVYELFAKFDKPISTYLPISGEGLINLICKYQYLSNSSQQIISLFESISLSPSINLNYIMRDAEIQELLLAALARFLKLPKAVDEEIEYIMATQLVLSTLEVEARNSESPEISHNSNVEISTSLDRTFIRNYLCRLLKNYEEELIDLDDTNEPLTGEEIIDCLRECILKDDKDKDYIYESIPFIPNLMLNEALKQRDIFNLFKQELERFMNLNKGSRDLLKDGINVETAIEILESNDDTEIQSGTTISKPTSIVVRNKKPNRALTFDDDEMNTDENISEESPTIPPEDDSDLSITPTAITAQTNDKEVNLIIEFILDNSDQNLRACVERIAEIANSNVYSSVLDKLREMTPELYVLITQWIEKYNQV